MIDRMITKTSIHLPAMIAEATFSGPVLRLSGEGWSLVVTTAWRVTGQGGLVFGAYSSDVSDGVWDLVGSYIEAIVPQSKLQAVDPAFILSSGLTLEVFSLDPVEPWVFRIADQVWVASPSDLTAFDG